MKKYLAIVLIACVSLSLFATGTAKVGGAFNFVVGSTNDFEENGTVQENSAGKYKATGLGFDVAGTFDISNDLLAWADFNMVFCFDMKSKKDGEDKWSSMNDYYDNVKEMAEAYGGTAYKRYNIISIGAGVAYKILKNDPLNVAVGGGLFFERGLARVGVTKDGTELVYIEFKAINIGISLYADATYKFGGNFGISLTAMPRIGLYNSSAEAGKYQPDEDEDTGTAKGFKISFSTPVTIGATYSF